MRTQELKKLQEKVLKWCITENKKERYAYQIDREDILVCNGYMIHRIPLKCWFVDLRTIPKMNLVEAIPSENEQQQAYMTDELKEVKNGTARIFKLEDGNTVWINEKFIKECGGADYLRECEITGKNSKSPLVFKHNGTMECLILPISQK